jgi:Beta-ketoacyl synthase, N-terminal domain
MAPKLDVDDQQTNGLEANGLDMNGHTDGANGLDMNGHTNGVSGLNMNGHTDGVNGHASDASSEASTRQGSFPIAIIGMSCKLPGDATSPEKLWELCAQGRDAWSEIPESRFNQKAFYHPEYERVGMVWPLMTAAVNADLPKSNAKGAHFMKEDISLFDTSFFQFSTDVANVSGPVDKHFSSSCNVRLWTPK